MAAGIELEGSYRNTGPNADSWWEGGGNHYYPDMATALSLTHAIKRPSVTIKILNSEISEVEDWYWPDPLKLTDGDIQRKASASLSTRTFYKNEEGTVYTKNEGDIIIEDSGSIIIDPPFMGTIILTKQVDLRGVNGADTDDKEFRLLNRSGKTSIIRANYSEIGDYSFNIPVNIDFLDGEELVWKSFGGKWILSENTGLVAFSDRLDAVGANITIDGDGKIILYDLLNKNTFDVETLRETLNDIYGNALTDLEVDNVAIHKLGAKYLVNTRIQSGDPVSVLMYNADPTGVTDSTAAIQAAINQRVSDWIIIPKGNFVISDAITLRDGVRLEGMGFNSLLDQTNLSKNGIIIGENCTVYGINIKGHNVADTLPDGFTNSNGIYGIGKKNTVIERCFINGFGANGIQLRDCYDIFISKNRIFNNVLGNGTSSDIILYSPTDGGRITIDSNICTSNNSQGIFVSGLGDDHNFSITNNKCVTMDLDGVIITSEPDMRKRHGIMVGYNGGKTTRGIITGNHCIATAWTGIYIQSSGTPSGQDLISNNICIDNGYRDQTISGGIFIAEGGVGQVVSNNLIIGYKNPIFTCGAINYSASATNKANITGNVIVDSAGNGISLGSTSNSSQVEGNYIINSARHDITAIISTDTENGKHVIRGNTISRNNAYFASIYCDIVGQTGKYNIENNTFNGFSKADSNISGTLGSTGNVAISLRQPKGFIIKNNHIRNFYVGITLVAYFSGGRNLNDLIINGNTIESCTYGVCATTSSTANVLPVYNTHFIDVTNQKGVSPYNASGSGVIWFAQKFNNFLQVETASAPPTTGTWIVGDTCRYSAPVLNGHVGAVCVTAGNPGTWSEYGSTFKKAVALTSAYDVTVAPVDGFNFYSTSSAKFVGSPEDASDWFIERKVGASHAVAIQIAINRTNGELFTQAYYSGSWLPWVSSGFQLDANGNAVIANTKKFGNGVANSSNWMQVGNGATIHNVPTSQQHIFQINGATVAGIDGNGDIYVEGVGKGIIIKSPDGTPWRLSPDDTGATVWTEIV